VLELALSIPPGRVTSYGALARAAGGGALAAQSVSGVLGKAWDQGEHGIPWHRIVYSDGRVWMSNDTRKKRLALYKKERIKLDDKDRIIDFADKLYEF
jgi:methylated-DNA-protein-cysteine methyltransferase-like protein